MMYRHQIFQLNTYCTVSVYHVPSQNNPSAVNSEQVKAQKGELTVFQRRLTGGWQAAQGPSYVGVETHSPPGRDREPNVREMIIKTPARKRQDKRRAAQFTLTNG